MRATGRSALRCLGVALAVIGIVLPAPREAAGGWQNFRGLTDGLANSRVETIVEDVDGSLWFGTGRGASRYDGLRWTTVVDSLPNQTVLALIRDRSGALWFGTEGGGVGRLDADGWTTFDVGTGLPGNQVGDILEDHRGDIWIGTPGGLSRYQSDVDTWTHYDPSNSALVHPNAWRLLEDGSNNLWVASPRGVTRLDESRGSWTQFTLDPAGLARDSVLALGEDLAGGIWFGTDQGVFRYDGAQWTQYRTADGLTSDPVTVIHRDSEGGMWFGGFWGLARFDGRVWRQFIATSEGQFLRQVLDVREDGSGNLWIATADVGLFRFDRVSWANFFSNRTSCPARPSSAVPNLFALGSNCISELAEDHRGEVWVTLADGGVSRLNRTGGWSTYDRRSGVALSDSLGAVIEDAAGRLWLASAAAGLMELDSTRTVWTLHTRASGLPGDSVTALLGAVNGDVWAGTGDGLGRYRAGQWSTFLTAGAPRVEVIRMVQDGRGRLWFWTSGGLHRLDDPDGTPQLVPRAFDDEITALDTGASGRVYVGTDRGLHELDGDVWTKIPSFGSQGDSVVNAILEDSSGRLWIGTRSGAVVRDGSTWTHFGGAVIGSAPVRDVYEDRQGVIYLATFAGLSLWNGDTWRQVGSGGDGLSSSQVNGSIEDHLGMMWFTSNAGLTRHGPDRVAPQTVFTSSPPSLTTSRLVSFVFGGGYGEASDLEFRYSWDGGPWSSWTRTNDWSLGGVEDGPHAFEVVARDWARNEDPTVARYEFEVDATPPAAVLASPQFGQAVRGNVFVVGDAVDGRFAGYTVAVRARGAPSWDVPHAQILAMGDQPALADTLALWDTAALPDGLYELRLAVRDTLGLEGASQIQVMIDNHAPFVDVTSPAAVTAADGGNVYTVTGDAHLYFPPGAFSRDATVVLESGAPMGTPPPGAIPLTPAYAVTWTGGTLNKPAVLDAGFEPGLVPGGLATVVFVMGADSLWSPLGGTASNGRVACEVKGAGTYAAFATTPIASGAEILSGVRLSPRVFSLNGRFGARELAVSFSLGRGGRATVKIYNRAGRLVQTVADGLMLPAGSNVLRWDGRNRDGGAVNEGMYLLSVEVNGQRQTKTFAVVP